MDPFHNLENVPRNKLPLSPSRRVGDLVFISGQASVDPQGTIVPDTFAAEMLRSFRNVSSILQSEGLKLRDVVQVRSYVNRQDDLEEYNRIYAELFSPPYPVRTTLIGCLGTLLKFEVDVIANAIGDRI